MDSARPHRKLVKHYHEPGDFHVLTFSCYQRLPLVTNDLWRERLARCIDAAGQQTGIKLAAFVFMPEHVHLLVVPCLSVVSIDRYLAFIKQPWQGEHWRSQWHPPKESVMNGKKWQHCFASGRESEPAASQVTASEGSLTMNPLAAFRNGSAGQFFDRQNIHVRFQ
ncbi:MAG: transposase [Pirellulales bacterium]